MTKILKYFFVALFLFGIASSAKASEKIDIYFFRGEGCPHCAKEEIFLNQLKQEDENIRINGFEIWNNRDNANFLGRVAKELEIKVSGVPVTVIGNQYVVGYGDDETTGAQIKSIINGYKSGVVYNDVVAPLIENAQPDNDRSPREQEEDNDQTGTGDTISSRFFGNISLKSLSLPILTIVVGSLDSLNPCAMWVLLFLISMLIPMNNRKRMWLLGGAFIFGSAAAYYVFLSAWLNVYLFIGYIYWIKVAIALAAIFAGVFNLRQFWKNRNGGCEVSENPTKRKFITGKLVSVIQSNSFLLALFGVVVLAAAINLVELLCSAGLPAVYIPILTMANLAKWQYYLYLLLYTVFYVLPQVIVFLIAMFTLEATAISSKFTKWSTLVGGILMLVIGILLLFAPRLLTFG